MEKIFIAGKRGKIVCAGDCYHVNSIKPENRMIFSSVEEALASGCKRVCKDCRGKYKEVSITKETSKVIIQNQEPKNYISPWDGTEIIRFGLVGDTQFGSKYAQITELHKFYDLCQSLGITDIYHTGDITDGLKMRPGHEYELYAISADEQLEDVIRNYPKREGIVTHFITGNHDASLYKHVGYDIGNAIAKERPDMQYLGRDCAIVQLTPNCKMELRHPWDGTAYALSYKVQKMIEAMDADSKPNILAVGHYHKYENLFYRNIHAVQTGCYQSQSPYMRGKGISASMGGSIVTIRVNADGTIMAFDIAFIPVYAPIKDDYKNWYLKGNL